MNEAILSFKLLTLVLGSPPPPHGPCSSPNSILALPQTTKLFLPSTLLPILFPAGNALSPALAPFSNCHLSVLPENSPRISGPPQPCPSLWPSLVPRLCLLKGQDGAEVLGWGGGSLTQQGAGLGVGMWLTEASPPGARTWETPGRPSFWLCPAPVQG